MNDLIDISGCLSCKFGETPNHVHPCRVCNILNRGYIKCYFEPSEDKKEDE